MRYKKIGFLVVNIMLIISAEKLFAGPPIEQLLTNVAHHEIDQAEVVIKMNPNVLLEKGSVIDYSNRVFDDITPFQYALWAYDKDMWNMILKYLTRDEAIKQYNEFPSSPAAAKYGAHYELNELLSKQHDFVDHCLDIYGDICIEKITKVALEERMVPAHYAKTLTQGDWYPLSPYIGLGYDWVRVLSGDYVCDVDYDYYRRRWCPTSHAMYYEISADIRVVEDLQKNSFQALKNLQDFLGISIRAQAGVKKV